jgi:hypothetical protein
MVELYLYSAVSLHGVALISLSTETSLPLPHPKIRKQIEGVSEQSAENIGSKREGETRMWEKLYNKVFQNLYFSTHIIVVNK